MAQGLAQQHRRQHQHQISPRQPPAIQPHRRGLHRIAAVVQGTGQPGQLPQDDDIQRQQQPHRQSLQGLAQQAGEDQHPIPQHQGPRRLGGGLFLPGLAANLPHAPPQAQAHQPEQDAQSPGYGRLQPGDHPGQDGAHNDGIASPQHRQGYGQPPAAAQAAVLLPQGPEPQHQQDAAHHGQKMLQIPEVQGDAGQSDAPQNAAHGLPPGGHPGRQLLLRQLLQQGLHIPVKADVVRHSRSPPNSFRSLCRRRYSRPSAARSVMPSSAAIWAVDWQ